MTQTRVNEVNPMERFRIRVSGRLSVEDWPVRFDRRSRYYHCPKCSARTLIDHRKLDIFNPPQSPFPTDTQSAFGEVPDTRAALDFYCKGCQAPVRLLFWGQERGMGGWWYGYVTKVLELV